MPYTFILAPPRRPDGCHWPPSARRQSPCVVDDLFLTLYAQDSPGNGCTQDCGPGSDIKTAIRAHWSIGTIDRGKEQCPNANTTEISVTGGIGMGVYVGRAWRNNLWASSVVIEWWAYRWNSGGGSFALVQASWLGVVRSKTNVPVVGINGQACATAGSRLCTCTCYDDGTFTFV